SISHGEDTRHPTAEWVVQKLREAFPEAGLYRYAILDHGSKIDADVIAFLKATGLRPKRTSVQAPWQNGTAERWGGSCRREILDHAIALDDTPAAAHSRITAIASFAPFSSKTGFLISDQLHISTLSTANCRIGRKRRGVMLQARKNPLTEFWPTTGKPVALGRA